MRLTEQHRKRISSLRRAKSRKEHGLSLVEGSRAVGAAIMAHAPIAELIATPEALEALNVPLPPGLDVYEVSPAVIERIAEVSTSQGILATFRIPDQRSLSDMGQLSRVVLLDGVQDPGNVGTIIRTSAWFGVDAIISGPGTADAFSPKVARATMGALWSIEIRRTSDLPRVVSDLAASGMTMLAASASGQELDGLRLANAARVGLVLGAEAHGVSAGLAAAVSATVAIAPASAPPPGVDSLNVAVAAGIFMERLFGARRET